jgi:hypothetical protein
MDTTAGAVALIGSKPRRNAEVVEKVFVVLRNLLLVGAK